MEDTNNNMKKSSPKVLIIALIIIVALLVIIGFLGKNLKNKNDELNDFKQEYSKLKNDRKKLRDYIERNMGEEYLNIIDFFDETNKVINIEEKYNTKAVNEKTDEEIEKAILNYLKLENLFDKSKAEGLKFLKLADSKDIEKYENGKLILDEYYATNIKINDFKKALSKYISENKILKMFDERDDIKVKDGFIYYTYYEGSNLKQYDILNIKKDKSEDNVFYVKIKENNDINDDDYYDEKDYINNYIITLTCNSDGELVVDNFEYDFFDDYEENDYEENDYEEDDYEEDDYEDEEEEEDDDDE